MDLRIKKVTVDNWEPVAMLSVAKDQQSFIESNSFSLAQSQFEKGWHPVAIYNNSTIIGFAMFGKSPSDNTVWLDRFMIDTQFQGHGYGKKALLLLINTIKKIYHPTRVFLSVHPKNYHAQKLYQRFGFQFNGKIAWGENIMVLNAA